VPTRLSLQLSLLSGSTAGSGALCSLFSLCKARCPLTLTRARLTTPALPLCYLVPFIAWSPQPKIRSRDPNSFVRHGCNKYLASIPISNLDSLLHPPSQVSGKKEQESRVGFCKYRHIEFTPYPTHRTFFSIHPLLKPALKKNNPPPSQQSP